MNISRQEDGKPSCNPARGVVAAGLSGYGLGFVEKRSLGCFLDFYRPKYFQNDENHMKFKWVERNHQVIRQKNRQRSILDICKLSLLLSVPVGTGVSHHRVCHKMYVAHRIIPSD